MQRWLAIKYHNIIILQFSPTFHPTSNLCEFLFMNFKSVRTPSGLIINFTLLFGFLNSSCKVFLFQAVTATGTVSVFAISSAHQRSPLVKNHLHQSPIWLKNHIFCPLDFHELLPSRLIFSSKEVYSLS